MNRLRSGCAGCLGLIGLLFLLGLCGTLLGPSGEKESPTPTATFTRVLKVTSGPSISPTSAQPFRPTRRPLPARTGRASVATPIKSPTVPQNVPEGAEIAQVRRVVDGDTIEVTVNGKREGVRYIGLDAPEKGWPGYRASTEANRRLVEGRQVYLVRDVEERDRYNRLLRYVYTTKGILVNLYLIQQGWAIPVEYPPNTRYAQEFLAAAQEAAREKRGFWSGDSPYDGAMLYGLVNAERGANIRKGPGTDFPINGAVPKDTPLVIFGRTPGGDWLQVRAPNRTGGWMAAFLVDLNTSVAEIPVAQNIPPRPTPRTQPQLVPTQPSAVSPNCDPSYPDVCIPPPPPDLDCKDIPYRRFRVLPPDPHRFDGDHDGIGCER